MEQVNVLTVLPRVSDWQEEGDYFTQEGVLMCGKCNTPKMAFVTVPGLFENRPSPRNCRCEQARAEQKEAEYKRRIALENIERLRKQGLTSAQYMESKFSMDDHADEKASKICTKYVDKWEEIRSKNIGLMLYGDVGGGKTFYASCIANALIYKGEPVIMTTIPDLTTAMKANFGQERASILNHIRTVPLLILDDVGIAQNTATSLDYMYEIINTRYKAKRPLVITTNLTMRAIKDEKDTKVRRIYDRLIEMCTPVNVAGTERRKQIARTKYQEFSKILEIN